MSLWLELRCDRWAVNCFSRRNDGPKALTESYRTAQLRAVRSLEREARLAGWKFNRVKKEWRCPSCAKIKEGQ